MNLLKQLSILILLFCTTLVFCQPSDLPPNRKPGSCYAKAYVPVSSGDDSYTVKVEKYPVYIGERPQKVKVKTEKIITKPAEKAWIKKRSSANCISDDPNDCYIMCWEDITKEESITLDVLKKPNKLDADKWEYKEVEILKKKGGDIDWYEVVCAQKITPSLIKEVQQMLTSKGFNPQTKPGLLDAKTKSALSMYQKANNLPVGQLDVLTLASFGMKL